MVPTYWSTKARLRVELLYGDGVFLHEPFVAIQIQFRVRQQRLIALANYPCICCRAASYGRGSICGDELPLSDQLPFGEGDLLKNPADLRSHGHSRERRDRSQRRDAQLDFAECRRGYGDGNRGVLVAATSARTTRRRLRCVAEMYDQEDRQQDDGADDQCNSVLF